MNCNFVLLFLKEKREGKPLEPAMNSESYDRKSQPNMIYLEVFHFHFSKTKILVFRIDNIALASSITSGVVMEVNANHDENTQLRHPNKALLTFINMLR